MADSTDHRKWFERAKQDLKMISLVYTEGLNGMEDSFCYLCHQAAEKLLKALLLKYEKTAPKSHDLIFLLGKCQIYENSLSKLLNSLTILNEYSVAARYPNDFEDKRTIEDAKEAYTCISEVNNELSLIGIE
jgi:HEPN domain-containing protein